MKYLVCPVCRQTYMIETPDTIDPTTFTCPMCVPNSPTPYICTAYVDNAGNQSVDNPPYTRCTSPAVYYLIDHHGKRNPGSRLCEVHATQCIVEYADKLGWEWSVEEIRMGVVVWCSAGSVTI